MKFQLDFRELTTTLHLTIILMAIRWSWPRIKFDLDRSLISVYCMQTSSAAGAAVRRNAMQCNVLITSVLISIYIQRLHRIDTFVCWV